MTNVASGREVSTGARLTSKKSGYEQENDWALRMLGICTTAGGELKVWSW